MDYKKEHTDRHQRRRRSRSPDRHKHRSHRKRSDSPTRPPIVLPFGQRSLSKHDLGKYRALLGLYLDLQKRLDIDELPEDEVKGRWKSFLGKWNRGELSEGYYDPVTKVKADKTAVEMQQTVPSSRNVEHSRNRYQKKEEDDESDDDDEFGPSLPGQSGDQLKGPRVPTLDDIQARREQAIDDEANRREDMRYERKQERKTQKERLEDLVPRAEAGTRERQLEKKKETAAVNRSFREAKSPGAEEIGERDLLGDDGIDGYKRQMQADQKKKSERELRKEEALRARTAEREEKLAEHRAKEAKTMDMLKSIARQRYG